MKKHLIKTVGTLLVFALCFVFAACGDPDDGKDGPGFVVAPTYTVTYDLNGGTGTVPTEAKKESGAKFNLASADGITNGDKTFTGWNDGYNTYAAGAEYTMPGKAVTFKAQWRDAEQPPVSITYAVTYDLNGGTGTAPTETNKAKGEKFNLASADGFTNGDKFFAGWNDGESTYAGGAQYTMPEKAVTFRAQWTSEIGQNALTDNGVLVLNFENNTGRLLYSDDYGQERTANLTFTISGKAIEISVGGQTFNGSYENGIVTITIVFAQETYRFGEYVAPPMTLPTVNFDANGGTGNAPVVSDSDFTLSGDKYRFKLPSCTFTAPSGKVFDKWAVNTDNNTYNAGTTYFADSGETINLKAIWRDTTTETASGTEFYGRCTLPRQEINGVVFEGLVVTKIYVDIPNSKVFYQLDGEALPVKSSKMITLANTYNPSNYGADSKYYEIEIKTIRYNIAVKADMTKLLLCTYDDAALDNGEFISDAGIIDPGTEYTVTFEYNLGEAAQTVKVESGNKVTKPQDPVHPSGKYFRYWRDDNTRQEYDFNSVVTGDISLTAVYAWKLTFSAGEGSGNIDPVYVVTGRVELPDADGLSCGSKTFTGWSDGKTTYQPGDMFMPMTNVTFTAQWETPVTKYTVTFVKSVKYKESQDAQGEIPVMPSKAQGEKITLPQNPFTLAGYSFVGWTVQEFGGIDDFGSFIWNTVATLNPNEEYTVGTKNIRIAATWQQDAPTTVTVTYKAGAHGTGANVVETNVSTGQYTLKNNTFVVDNFWTFIGWQVEGASSDEVLGETYNLTGNTVFVAQYLNMYGGYANDSPASLQLYFDTNDGGFMPDGTFDSYVEVTITSIVDNNITVKIGSASFTGTLVDNVLNMTITYGGKTYTFGTGSGTTEPAQKYTVTYNLGGGTGTLPTETEKSAGEKFNLAAATGLTNGDKTFDGWSDGTNKYDAGAEYTMPSNNVMLTAQWKDATGGETTEYSTVNLKDMKGRYNGTIPIPIDNKGNEYISVGILYSSGLGYSIRFYKDTTITTGRTYALDRVGDAVEDVNGVTFTATHSASQQKITFAFVKNGESFDLVIVSVQDKDNGTQYLEEPIVLKK